MERMNRFFRRACSNRIIYLEYRADVPCTVYEPGASGVLEGAGCYYLRWENGTGGPATPYESYPYMYDVFGPIPRWLDGQPVETIDDVIAVYGDPASVYATDKFSPVYIWGFTGGTDAYTFAYLHNNTIQEIICVRDCDALHKAVNENNVSPSNLFDILTEIGLYQ